MKPGILKDVIDKQNNHETVETILFQVNSMDPVTYKSLTITKHKNGMYKKITWSKTYLGSMTAAYFSPLLKCLIFVE